MTGRSKYTSEQLEAMRREDALSIAPGETPEEQKRKKMEEEKAKAYRQARSAEIRKEQGQEALVAHAPAEEMPEGVKVVLGKPESAEKNAAKVLREADDAEIQRILENIREMPEDRV